MRILYVNKKYVYRNPERGFGFEHYNFYDSLVNMDNQSHEIIYFPVDEMLHKISKEKINEKLLEKVFNTKPDLMFFAAGGIIDKETVKKITEESSTLTLAWMSDDHWIFERSSKYWAPYFNWVVTTDSEAPAKYRRIGYKNIIRSQWACNPRIYKKLNLPKIYDVSFVGHPHSHRKKVVNRLKKTGIDIHCWGRDWPNGRVSQKEMVRIFSQSKICLNFARSSGVIWKELASIFLRRRGYDQKVLINTPRAIKDRIKGFPACVWSKQIKGRNFEVPCCGSFLLTEYADDLKNYYRIGKEIACFEETEDLVEKIRYYLEHEKEREAIARAGYERTLKEHTWEKRFNEIFKKIGLKKYA